MRCRQAHNGSGRKLAKVGCLHGSYLLSRQFFNLSVQQSCSLASRQCHNLSCSQRRNLIACDFDQLICGQCCKAGCRDSPDLI